MHHGRHGHCCLAFFAHGLPQDHSACGTVLFKILRHSRRVDPSGMTPLPEEAAKCCENRTGNNVTYPLNINTTSAEQKKNIGGEFGICEDQQSFAFLLNLHFLCPESLQGGSGDAFELKCLGRTARSGGRKVSRQSPGLLMGASNTPEASVMLNLWHVSKIPPLKKKKQDEAHEPECRHVC